MSRPDAGSPSGSLARVGLARALAALVSDEPLGGPDVSDVLAHLVADAREAVGAAAVAVLSPEGHDGSGGLALLAATSHRAAEIEMLQAHQHEGPCIEAVDAGAVVRAQGADDIVARWPRVGRAMAAAGYVAVEAFPMRWRGTSLGGLNLFFDATPPLARDDGLTQAYADMGALVVAQSTWRSTAADVRGSLREALAARETVEMAKGVVAEETGSDLETAYQKILAEAETSGLGLTRLAEDIVHRRRRST